MILLRVDGGLCNRLRVIESAVELSRVTGHRLHVFWKCDAEMNALFSDLFESTDRFVLHESRKEGFWQHLFFSRLNFVCKFVGRSANLQERIRRSVKLRPWAITAFSEIYAPTPRDFSWLKPKNDLADEVERHMELLGEHPIGLHIRRTDNVKSIQMSPLSLFEEQIKLALDVNPDQKFFLATDDDATKNILKREFGDVIYTREGVARREESAGVRDAVVDLFCLSRCERLFGSYYSSFSSVASYIGNPEYKVLKIS